MGLIGSFLRRLQRLNRLKRRKRPKYKGNALQIQDTAESQPRPVDVVQQDTVHPSPGPVPQPGPQRLPCDASRVWNQAYAALRKDESQLLAKFESLMAHQIAMADPTEPVNEVSVPQHTVSPQDMVKIINSGLKRTEKQAQNLQNAKEIMAPILKFKETIGSVISLTGDPIATSACTGVFLGLSLVVEPLQQNENNRKGMTYILSRLEWYSAMVPLLLGEDPNAQSGGSQAAVKAMRESLEERVVNLHKAIISYSIRGVLSYYRNQVYVHLRGTLGLDDWQGLLKAVVEAETLLQKDSEKFGQLTTIDHLKVSAKSLQIQLEGLLASLNEVPAAIDRQTATQQDWRDEDKDEACLKELREATVDSRDEAKSLEGRKEPLFADAYEWLFATEQYKTFASWDVNVENPTRLLWIRGGPGAGKTMLTMGVAEKIGETLSRDGQSSVLSLFFAQARNGYDNATAVLSGLVWLLADQKKQLIPHLRDRWDRSGKSLFRDGNAFIALSETLRNMLQDESLDQVVLIVDALDECKQNLKDLVELLVDITRTCLRVKVLVTSRPLGQNIEKILDGTPRQLLTLGSDLLTSPVNLYIDHKIKDLHEYNSDVKQKIKERLKSNAAATFLWVALVFQELSKESPRYYSQVLAHIPNELTDLYDGMLKQIDQLRFSREHCKDVLRFATVAIGALTMEEIRAQLRLSLSDNIRDIVRDCGPLVLVREDRLFFVHESAKEHVSTKFWKSNTKLGHSYMAEKCLKVMQQGLRRNICGLTKPDAPPPDPKSQGLALLVPLSYSCIHWVDHLHQSESEERDLIRLVYDVLKEKFLNWIEALSLLQQYVIGPASIERLISSLKMETPMVLELRRFLMDARRFLLYHRRTVELYPMQIYLSALIFTPTNSIVRQTFQNNELPSWIVEFPSLLDEWDATVQDIMYSDLRWQEPEYYTSIVDASAASSGNSFAFICGRFNNSDAENSYFESNVVAVINSDGKRLYTCRHTGNVSSIAFLPEGKLVSSTGNTVQIWDTQGRPETSHTFEWDPIADEEEGPSSQREATYVNEHQTNSFVAQDMIVNSEGRIILSRSEGNILRIYSFLGKEKQSTSYDLTSLGQSKYPFEHSQTHDDRIILWRQNPDYGIENGSSTFSAGDGHIHVLDLSKESEIQTRKHTSSHILNLSKESTIHLRKHTSFITSVSSNLHARVSSISADGQLILWDREGGIERIFQCGGDIVKVLLLENDFIITQHHQDRAYSSKADDICLWNPNGKRERRITITASPAKKHILLALPLSKNQGFPHIGVHCGDKMVILDTNLLKMEKDPKPPVEYCLPAFQAQTVTQFLRNGNIEVIDVRRRSTKKFSPAAGNTSSDPYVHNEVSPYGSRLCRVDRKEDHDIIHVFDSKSGQETRKITTKLRHVRTSEEEKWNPDNLDCRMMASRSHISFSADNRFMAWITDSGIVRAELKTGKTVNLKFGHWVFLEGSHLALSPDGQYAAIATHLFCFLRVYDLQGGKLVQSLDASMEPYYLDWSMSGEYLAMFTPPDSRRPECFMVLDMRCLSSNSIDGGTEARSCSESPEQHVHDSEMGSIPPELEPFANSHDNTAFGSYLRQSLLGTSEHPKFWIDFGDGDWIMRNNENIIFIPEEYGMRTLVRIGEDKGKVDVAGLTEGGDFIWFTFSTDESEFQQFAANSGWTV